MPITRRTTFLAGAALTLAAPALLRPRPAAAQGVPAALPLPPSRTIVLGNWRVSALLAGMGQSQNPQETFGLNVEPETFARVSAENFIPADRSVGFFTPTLVDTGSERILFDTGMNAGGIVQALQHAGHAPGDVTHVVLTHMHPDHIGGLTDDTGAATFPAATCIAGRAEFDHWAAQGNENFEAKVRPFAETMTFVEPDQEVIPGITAIEAHGHTPGHLVFRLESAGQPLMLTADTANHHVWSLAHPDWEVRFDADKDRAARTRRRILGMVAAERMPMLGYHLPFPAIGYVEVAGDGFRWVPMTYQFL